MSLTAIIYIYIIPELLVGVVAVEVFDVDVNSVDVDVEAGVTVVESPKLKKHILIL